MTTLFSNEILSKTSETYTRIEKLQRMFTVATAPNQPITTDTFKPIILGQNFDITPELRFREDALDVLNKYTNLLAALSSDDYQANIDKASLDLAGSLENLSSTALKSDSETVPKVTATLIDVMGKQIVDHEKKEALKKAMDMSQQSIESLSRLVVSSNDKIKDFVNNNIENQLIAHANITRPKYGSIERYEYDLKVANMISEVEEINSALDIIDQSMIQYPKAHKEIRASLETKMQKLKR